MAPLDVVQFLVEQWPGSVKTGDVQGRLPVHYACDIEAPAKEVIEFLVAQWPDAIKMTNVHEKTPLELAEVRKRRKERRQTIIDVMSCNKRDTDEGNSNIGQGESEIVVLPDGN
jgi:hypothetical protein